SAERLGGAFEMIRCKAVENELGFAARLHQICFTQDGKLLRQSGLANARHGFEFTHRLLAIFKQCSHQFQPNVMSQRLEHIGDLVELCIGKVGHLPASSFLSGPFLSGSVLWNQQTSPVASRAEAWS